MREGGWREETFLLILLSGEGGQSCRRSKIPPQSPVALRDPLEAPSQPHACPLPLREWHHGSVGGPSYTTSQGFLQVRGKYATHSIFTCGSRAVEG